MTWMQEHDKLELPIGEMGVAGTELPNVFILQVAYYFQNDFSQGQLKRPLGAS